MTKLVVYYINLDVILLISHINLTTTGSIYYAITLTRWSFTPDREECFAMPGVY